MEKDKRRWVSSFVGDVWWLGSQEITSPTPRVMCVEKGSANGHNQYTSVAEWGWHVGKRWWEVGREWFNHWAPDWAIPSTNISVKHSPRQRLPALLIQLSPHQATGTDEAISNLLVESIELFIIVRCHYQLSPAMGDAARARGGVGRGDDLSDKRKMRRSIVNLCGEWWRESVNLPAKMREHKKWMQ